VDRFFTPGKLPLTLEVSGYCPANSSLNGLRDKDFSRARQFFESVGDIDRISDRREVRAAVGSDISHNHYAGVNSDPQIDCYSARVTAGLDLPISLGDRISDLNGRGYRTHRMIGMGNRSAEVGHHRVAHEFIDGSTVFENSIRRELKDFVE
jgi:hypothetical protein